MNIKPMDRKISGNKCKIPPNDECDNDMALFPNPATARNYSQTILKVEFQKFEYAQRGLPRSRSLEPKSFSRQVSRILKTEINKISKNEPVRDSLATVNSRSPSDSPEPETFVSASPPSTPPTPSGGSEEFEIERDVEEISMPRQRVHRRRIQSEPPVSLVGYYLNLSEIANHPQQPKPPLSASSSSLEAVAEVEIQDEGSSVQELHDQNENQGQGKQGAYVKVPPDGSLKYGPRPKAGRVSSDPSSSSSSIMRRQGDTTQRQSHPHSNSRRKNRSDISTYGDEGEVTPTHLTGFIGLPPRSRKERDTGSQ